MNISQRILLSCCGLALVCAGASAQNYAPVGGRIATEWAAKVNPSKVWNEYPRPLLVRDQWTNLNGLWDYAITAKNASPPSTWKGRILVPFALESSLSGVGDSLSADQALWYHLTFKTPKHEAGKRVRLNFGAVDWDARVWVNGHEVGNHQGGYTAFSFDITEALNTKGSNELVVRVLDGTDTGFQPCGKQRSKTRGIWYTPVSGIWQTVWLETVPDHGVTAVTTTTDLAASTAHVAVGGGALGMTIEVEALSQDKPVAVQRVTVAGKTTTVNVKLPAPVRLWSPDEPNLYDLRITLRDQAGKVVDKVASYMAMREFGTRRDAEGHMRFTLNGNDIFQFGLLDQGWWPDGLYTAPSPEALRYDIDQTKQWGYNLIRKHVKVEPELWYAHCDHVGIIVWQDMPSGDYSTSPEWQREAYYRGPQNKRSQESIDNYYREWGDIIDQFRGFPCIASWIPFNERWGQFNTWSVAKWTKEKDPTRLVNPASGGNFCATGDVLDAHHYPEPVQMLWDHDRVNVVGEYGGIGYPIKGHTWVVSDDNWGYVKFNSTREVTDTYVEYATMLLDLARQGCSGAIYTQTTDCETEVNGIMTYDRRVVKMEMDRFSAINRQVTHSLGK
ncbi:MAG: beta-galactosidase [Muribaculaceae bacterium]|nr:beta-galactosidase [Muribaculaceae bacterium]